MNLYMQRKSCLIDNIMKKVFMLFYVPFRKCYIGLE